VLGVPGIEAEVPGRLLEAVGVVGRCEPEPTVGDERGDVDAVLEELEEELEELDDDVEDDCEPEVEGLGTVLGGEDDGGVVLIEAPMHPESTSATALSDPSSSGVVFMTVPRCGLPVPRVPVGGRVAGAVRR
jgi:hypothetical protein